MLPLRIKKPLWKESEKPSATDLKQAANCFKAMHEASLALPADGKLVSRAANTAVKSAVVMHGNMLDVVSNRLMEEFYWVKQRLEDAWDWVVEKIGQYSSLQHKVHDSSTNRE